MQEWIIAMLVISVLLVLRDMAKVFFRGRSFLKAEQKDKRSRCNILARRGQKACRSDGCRFLYGFYEHS